MAKHGEFRPNSANYGRIRADFDQLWPGVSQFVATAGRQRGTQDKRGDETLGDEQGSVGRFGPAFPKPSPGRLFCAGLAELGRTSPGPSPQLGFAANPPEAPILVTQQGFGRAARGPNLSDMSSVSSKRRPMPS